MTTRNEIANSTRKKDCDQLGGKKNTVEAESISPPLSCLSRKRPREMDSSNSSSIDPMTSEKKNKGFYQHDDHYLVPSGQNNEDLVVRGLRLEAIFHPKFDNERQKKGKANAGDIRSTMLEKLNPSSNDVQNGCGHLEVSLKHSGSLVLWSGSTRYYSKNSACNEFTRTAEILLRQWFERVRKAFPADGKTRPLRSYNDCSNVLVQNRYTIALEVVAAEMLGDHGQAPNIDYVVVTAIADRARESFLTTNEVLEFCHEFRLPHNDSWVFLPNKDQDSTCESAQSLFRLYDQTLRETGDTDTTVTELTKIADVYIPSPVPHSIFQGNICEGFIVRYVENEQDNDGQRRMEGLSVAAREILNEMSTPPMSPTPTPDNSLPSIESMDLRGLYQSVSTFVVSNGNSQEGGTESSPSGKDRFALQRERASLFSDRLQQLLATNPGPSNPGNVTSKRPRKSRLDDLRKLDSEQTTWTTQHLPTLAKDLIHSSDKETKRIARLLQTLDGIKGGAVTYTWMEKYDQDESIGQGDSTTLSRKRLYCIIHVHNDSTFFKFQRLQNDEDMTLFRGFCIEVFFRDPPSITVPLHVDPRRTQIGAPLMLKMKLLPYMIRTFICRNLLRTIEQKGPEDFEQIALGLLRKWNMSLTAQERWMPFLRGWALYVLQRQRGMDTPTDSQGRMFENTRKLDLGELTNFSYLRHLEYFTALFQAGKFKASPFSGSDSSPSPDSHPLVCFVSHDTGLSKAIANFFVNMLDERGVERKSIVCSLGEATKNRRSKSCFAYANISDQTKGIKKFICDKKVCKHLVLVLFASDKKDIITVTSPPTPDVPPPLPLVFCRDKADGKKLTNTWKSWKKFPCAKRIALPLSSLQFEAQSQESNAPVLSRISGVSDVVDAIEDTSQSMVEQAKQRSTRKGGILVFFPGIPGCGKSSLLGSMESELRDKFLTLKTENMFDRDVHVKEGDRVGKSFWNIIEDKLSIEEVNEVKAAPLVIADKNAPPASWPKLGKIRTDCNGLLLPVLPDATVLETTTIKGSILPDGKELPHASHFYPFSLKFLAISMARVLSRPAGEHTGKLDSGFPMACMVVVQFYAFYRYIAADGFMEKIGEKCDTTTSGSVLNPLKLPFLVDSARALDLPEDLCNLLIEALQLRHGYDKDKKFKLKTDDQRMMNLETRLRASITSHMDVILGMSVTLAATKESFVYQIVDKIRNVSTEVEGSRENAKLDSPALQEKVRPKNIKLLSLDLDRNELHKILRKYRESGALAQFFERIPFAETFPTPQFIEKTHVTMAFAGEQYDSKTLLSKYGTLQDRKVSVIVTGFLWSSTNGAFSVKLSDTVCGHDSLPVPQCENSFPHATIWCEMEAQEYWSNRLPSQVESGEACRVDFDGKDEVIGRLSFWDQDNQPIPSTKSLF